MNWRSTFHEPGSLNSAVPLFLERCTFLGMLPASNVGAIQYRIQPIVTGLTPSQWIRKKNFHWDTQSSQRNMKCPPWNSMPTLVVVPTIQSPFMLVFIFLRFHLPPPNSLAMARSRDIFSVWIMQRIWMPFGGRYVLRALLWGCRLPRISQHNRFHLSPLRESGNEPRNLPAAAAGFPSVGWNR